VTGELVSMGRKEKSKNAPHGTFLIRLTTAPSSTGLQNRWVAQFGAL
jgi:hypothetical protein